MDPFRHALDFVRWLSSGVHHRYTRGIGPHLMGSKHGARARVPWRNLALALGHPHGAFPRLYRGALSPFTVEHGDNRATRRGPIFVRHPRDGVGVIGSNGFDRDPRKNREGP